MNAGYTLPPQQQSELLLPEFIGTLLLAAIFILPNTYRLILGLGLLIILLNITYSLLFRNAHLDIPRTTKLLISFPPFYFFTLIAFLIASYSLHLSFAVEFTTVCICLLLCSSLLKFRHSMHKPRLIPAAKFHNVFQIERKDIELILVFFSTFSVYFVIFYRIIFLSGSQLYMFGDDASYLANFWSYFSSHAENLNYAGTSLFTLSSNFTYLSSTYSGGSFFFFIASGWENPILFYVVLTAFSNSIFATTFYALFLTRYSIVQKLILTICVICGFSLIGVIWFVAPSMLPKTFAGTPFPLSMPQVYLKGVSEEMFLKGAWQGPSFQSVMIFFYLRDGKSAHRHRRTLSLAYLLFTLLLYIPVGGLLTLIVIFTEIGYFLSIKKRWVWILWCAIPSVVIRLTNSAVSLPYVNLMATPYPFEISLAMVLSSVILVGTFLIICVFLMIESSFFPKVKRRGPVVSLLFVRMMIDSLSTISRRAIRFLASEASRRGSLAAALSLTPLFAILLFRWNLLPSLVSEDYLLGFFFTIGALLFCVILFDGDLQLSKSRKASIVQVLTLIVVSMMILPTLAYSSGLNYYGQQGFQDIYIGKDTKALASWIENSRDINGTLLVPPSLWYISSLTGRPILVSPYASANNPRLEFVESFYAPSVYYNFSNSSQLRYWFSYPGNGILNITTNQTLNNLSTLEVIRQTYSEASSKVVLGLSDLILSFAIFPEAVHQSYAVGVSLNLSDGQWLAFQDNNLSSSSYHAEQINLKPHEWNFITVNVTKLADTITTFSTRNTEVTQINLLGGLSPAVYWGYVSLIESPMAITHVINFLRGNLVSDIVVQNNHNVYLDQLVSLGLLKLLYKNHSYSLYGYA